MTELFIILKQIIKYIYRFGSVWFGFRTSKTETELIKFGSVRFDSFGSVFFSVRFFSVSVRFGFRFFSVFELEEKREKRG
ncbi:hypothetical protein DVH24_026646 [Malus domestica]|uniref:Uncharacterized protein n=1 Tax=Malus domestica TaxID=3750 RepID=A0A498K3Y2_MALDO|nr:hypothetical protein DVH24_026646 [Malus domestica]